MLVAIAATSIFVAPSYGLALNNGLIQVLEEGTERIFGDTFADGIIGNAANRPLQVCCGIIGQQCAIRFVNDVDMAGSVDRAARSFALHFQYKR